MKSKVRIPAKFVRDSDEWGDIFSAVCPDCGTEVFLHSDDLVLAICSCNNAKRTWSLVLKAESEEINE